MKWYRMYFFGGTGSFQGRHEFEAGDDLTAMTVAEHLCDACSDLCKTFELWDGVRRVDTSFTRMPHPAVLLEQISVAAQNSAIESEEAMLRSHWALARSELLIERVNLLIARQVLRETGATDISGGRKDETSGAVELPKS